MLSVLVTFPAAGIKYPDKKQPKGDRVYFGLQFKVIIPHGGEVTGAWLTTVTLEPQFRVKK